jgi:hypothetical protein
MFLIFVFGALLISACCCCCGWQVFHVLSANAMDRLSVASELKRVCMNPLAKAGEDERVIALLGAPIKDGGQMTMDFAEVKQGRADYSCAIVGPEAKGELVIKARKVDKTWSYEAVRVDVGDESIDLMPVDALTLVERRR